MKNVSKKDVDWLLNLHKGSVRDRWAGFGTWSWKKLLLWGMIAAAGIIALMIFPFILLVRTSVWLNVSHGMPAWLSLAGGAGVTILLLLAYLLFLFRKARNKKLLLKFGLAGAGAMVLGFCLSSLLYLSAGNAKSPDVREVYRSMHPVLRVAVASVTLADGDLVITDIERRPESYRAMGLPVNPNSQHYRREGGFVHAVDLRTRDRGMIRNLLLRGSLELMGFQTIRHIGTADHLHVELPLR